MTDRFRFGAKISDALFGQVLQLKSDDRLDGKTINSVLAVKCISMERAQAITSAADRTIDNPVQEQRAMALLAAAGGHPNVVQFYGHIIESNTMFIIMEFCIGGDLHSYIQDSTTDSCLRERKALEIMAQVLHGVHFIHSHGLAHRDLSLENVLQGPDGKWKIADFGLSTDATRISSDYVGKDNYMAPEIVAREAYDPTKADVWSLGIMWFMMLTGSPLLATASPSQKGYTALATHGVGPVFTAWGLRGRISDETIDLVARMLQIDPTKRISLMELLAHPMFRSN